MKAREHSIQRIKNSFWKFVLPIHVDTRMLLLGADEPLAASLRAHCRDMVHVPRFDALSADGLSFQAASFDSVIWVDEEGRFGMAGRTALGAGVASLLRMLAVDGSLIVFARNPNWPPTVRWLRPGAVSGGALETILAQAGLRVTRLLLSPLDGTARHLFSERCPGFVPNAGLSPRARLRRHVTATRLWNWLAAGFVFVAHKSAAAPQTLAGGIVADIERRTGKTLASIRGIQAGNPATCLLRVKFDGDGQSAIVRIPMEPYSLMRCERNYDFLRHASQYIPDYVPSTVASGVVDGQAYFAEGAVDGIAVDDPRFPLDAIAAEAAGLLANLHRASGRLANESLSRFIDDVFAGARKVGLVTGDDEASCAAYCRERLGRGVPAVLFHGDYKIENLIVHRSGFHVKGVIDWDLASESGAPLLDLLFLLTYRRITLTGQTFNRVFVDTVLADAWDSQERAVMRRYADAVQINLEDRLAYHMLFWLHHYAFRVTGVQDLSELRATFACMRAAIDPVKGAIRA